MRELHATDVETCRAKGADYSGTADVFTSFRIAEMFSGIPVPNQILYEMGKKISRVEKLLKQENQVSDEGIGDSLKDIRIYSAILQVYLEEQNRPAYQEVTAPYSAEDIGAESTLA